MGALTGAIGSTCQSCGEPDPTVRMRGRAFPMAELCDACWNDFADDLARYEGAGAPPRAEPGPDDFDAVGPPLCPECNGLLRPYPTNYDRWVDLASRELPAKDVPSRYRWRLIPLRARHSQVPTGFVAVRIRGVEPMPGELVMPAHVAVCLGPDASAEVEEARKADLRGVDPGDQGQAV
ncbi:DUF6083 domain-containing protein [Streptomyces sp. NPDC102264]|uniref:DUF6083 domain-containing protein n=1 Tax=Streptomyces sp. NPDC102264 TaxID=3366149 RepID=UPI0037FB7352